MKKIQFVIIATAMSFALCACGTEDMENKTSTEQTEELNISTEQMDKENNTKEQDSVEATSSETFSSQQTTEVSYTEFAQVLDEINTEIRPGTAGNSLTSIKVAAHLLNWGTGTNMGIDAVKEETVNWLSDKGNSKQVEFSEKLASVYEAYHKLLGPDANELLVEAGCEDIPYSWSTTPVETIEAIVEVVQLPEDTSEDTSTGNSKNDANNSEKSGYPDVAELVNLRGDETTVYLLADGRYMDRTSTVYTYDGVDTWTDESGVEWNQIAK